MRILLRVGRHERHIRVVVWRATRRTEAIEVLLDVPIAEEADLVAALARPEVLVRHVHVLHAEWAAWRRTTQGGGGSGL